MKNLVSKFRKSTSLCCVQQVEGTLVRSNRPEIIIVERFLIGKDVILVKLDSPDEHGGELDDGGVEEPPVGGGSFLSCSIACTRCVELQLVFVTLRDKILANYFTLMQICQCLQFSWCLDRNVLLSC